MSFSAYCRASYKEREGGKKESTQAKADKHQKENQEMSQWKTSISQGTA